ncbi:NAD(P)/FAD-dependent oxidoreductase [Allonocardiopsis opalescens]|uniref:D-arginine dehydrogenase n=1 Tax=Allonocardiopsis opalescens TaxID=1144618 RepID=A0A2T0QEZ9_9ACTN|nr:FAD-dependent oxidoreductase [Allonocardiopsis opalescens]PRY02516.1 D-arginine dehydrogenase [Allonocardiopsis opalescens]
MTDFLIVGGGIAGAAAGYFLSGSGRAVVLDMEAAAGHHSTGRSAALLSEYFGNAAVRGLTAAGRAFYRDPPEGFADHPVLGPRGVLALCPPGDEGAFEAALADGAAAAEPAREIGRREAAELVPIVRRERVSRALYRPGAMDIDVDAAHQGFLRGVRRAGGRVVTGARVRALARRGGSWRADTDAGVFTAPVVVNAAGAWADEVAGLAGVRRIGLTPLRRTAFLVDLPAGTSAAGWPMLCDVRDSFYAKPESGRLLVSPMDATPSPPVDARPADIDVALGVERLQAATSLSVRRVVRAWAGLRSSTADDTPVVGAERSAPGFFWLAALGGYGVQTAPAVGRLLAEAVTGAAATGAAQGAAAAVSPDRLN